MSSKLKFEVMLSRGLTLEEFNALTSAILAQCEEVTMEDGEERTIGYDIDSVKFDEGFDPESK